MRKHGQRIQRALLATLISVAIAAIWASVVGWMYTIVQSRQLRERPTQDLGVTRDGKLLLAKFSMEGYQVVDTQGNDATEDLNAVVPAVNFFRTQSAPLRALGWKQRVRGFSEYRPHVAWYLMLEGSPDEGVYFVGFDTKTKRQIGFIDRDGFRSTLPSADSRIPLTLRANDQQIVSRQYAYPATQPPEAQMYHVPSVPTQELPAWTLLIVSDGHLLRVDLRERTVRELGNHTDLISIGLPQWQLTPLRQLRGLEFDPSLPLAVGLTSSEILVLNGDGVATARFPRDAADADRMLSVHLLSETRCVVVSQDTVREPPGDVRVRWLATDGDGTRQRQETLPATFYPGGSVVETSRVIGLAMPSPLEIVTVGAVVTGQMVRSGASENADTVARQLLLVLLVASLISGLAAWACYRRQRRLGQTGWGWPVFVFWMGVPGLLGYLGHRSWPASRYCPQCRRAVPFQQVNCQQCRGVFPARERNGLEVFAS